MKKLSHYAWLKKYLPAILLMLGSYQQSLAQNFGSEKLSQQEKTWNHELDKFIDKWYDCVLPNPTQIFDGENFVDAEGILTDVEEESIEDYIESIKNKNNVKVLFVTKENMTENGTMADFGIALGNCLELWLSKVDNGILIQLDLQGRQSHIATGYRSETVLTDAECSRICRLWIPYFKEDDVPGGIKAILDGLNDAITVEEVKELTEAEKAEIERQRKENEAMLINILIRLMISGAFWWTAIYIYSKKNKFNELVEKYNKTIDIYDNTSKWLKNAVTILQEEQKSVQKIDTKKVQRAAKDFELAKENAEYTLKTNGSAEQQATYQKIKNSWYNFLKWKLFSWKDQSALDNDLGTIRARENNIKDTTQSILKLKDDVTKIQERLDNAEALRTSMLETKTWIQHEETWGFQFPGNKSNILSQVEQWIEDLDIFIQEDSLFTKKKVLLEDMDTITQEVINGRATISWLKSDFASNNKTIASNYITTQETEKYIKHMEKLENLLPREMVANYVTIYNNLKQAHNQQEAEKKEYEIAYTSKNIEQTSSLYKTIVQHKATVEQANNDIVKDIQEIQEKKNEIPKLIVDCQKSINQAKEDVHSSYMQELTKLQETFRTLQSSIQWAKVYDRVKWHSNLENIKEQAEEISHKSKKKYEEEERARLAAIAAIEAARQAEIKRAADARQEASRRSSNSWGWSFWWGGWWAKW